jgi:4'-phosphopantetheinyl transferase EntD
MSRCVSTPDETDAQALKRFLDDQLPIGCVGAVRLINPGDELLLTPVEAQGLDRAVPIVRRASGAGRSLARMLCGQVGTPVADIPRSPERYPVWPAGITGSIAHDAQFAAAVVAPDDQLGGIGIDIEPAQQLQPGISELVATAEELAAFSDLPFGNKALFSIKEAVFKAVYPHDRTFLDFHDVTVARGSQTATTMYGRTICWRILTIPRVLAIAWWWRDRQNQPR